jgi:hypothetical protein
VSSIPARSRPLNLKVSPSNKVEKCPPGDALNEVNGGDFKRNLTRPILLLTRQSAPEYSLYWVILCPQSERQRLLAFCFCRHGFLLGSIPGCEANEHHHLTDGRPNFSQAKGLKTLRSPKNQLSHLESAPAGRSQLLHRRTYDHSKSLRCNTYTKEGWGFQAQPLALLGSGAMCTHTNPRNSIVFMALLHSSL